MKRISKDQAITLSGNAYRYGSRQKFVNFTCNETSMREIDNYFLQKEEPLKSYLLALREFILKYDKNISEAWQYRMPFYCYNGKRFCYLWVHKKYHQPYIGIVDGKKINHPQLILEKRARMKIMLLDPSKDVPVKIIKSILKDVISLYK